MDPEVAVAQLGSGVSVAGPSALYPQIIAGLSGTLGSFALILALAGLYGVLSHVVARRTWEVGVRMALGATAFSVIRMILWDGLRPVIIGIILGTSIGALARLLIQPQFARVLLPPQSIIALISVPILMLVAGILACLFPARRAATINPNSALREL